MCDMVGRDRDTHIHIHTHTNTHKLAHTHALTHAHTHAYISSSNIAGALLFDSRNSQKAPSFQIYHVKSLWN